jgi:hypothetical protein
MEQKDIIYSHKNDSILVSELPPNGTRKHFDSHTKDSISVSKIPLPTHGSTLFDHFYCKLHNYLFLLQAGDILPPFKYCSQPSRRLVVASNKHIHFFTLNYHMSSRKQ